MLDYYIELDHGIPFKTYFENLMIATQPTLTIHCSLVSEISLSILDTLMQKRPELLAGVCGCADAEEAKARTEEIRVFLKECCFLHDAGQAVFSGYRSTSLGAS